MTLYNMQILKEMILAFFWSPVFPNTRGRPKVLQGAAKFRALVPAVGPTMRFPQVVLQFKRTKSKHI